MILQSLMESYTPETILHRDLQVTKIREVFTNFAEYGIASNMMLIGNTGSGKTCVLNSVFREYNNNHLYLSCNKSKTSNKILLDLAESKNKDRSDLLLEEIINKFRLNKRILIIDELNRLEDLKKFFDDLNTIYRETAIPIIIATNNPNILNPMNEDARLTLFFQNNKVYFPKYNAYELFDIISQRLSIFSEEFRQQIPEKLLRYICAIGGGSGSARISLDLLRRCIMSHDYSIEFVDKIIKEDKIHEWERFFTTINETERKFINSLVDLFVKKAERGSPLSITVYDLYKYIDYLSKPRISQLITDFVDKYCLLKTSYISKGRKGGNYRIIEFEDEDTFLGLREAI